MYVCVYIYIYICASIRYSHAYIININVLCNLLTYTYNARMCIPSSPTPDPKAPKARRLATSAGAAGVCSTAAPAVASSCVLLFDDAKPRCCPYSFELSKESCLFPTRGRLIRQRQ